MIQTHSPRMSRHAITRSQQRGIRMQEIDMIVTQGTVGTADRCFLDRDDGNALFADTKAALALQTTQPRTRSSVRCIRELRRRLRSIDRAMRTIVILCDDTVVTTYRNTNGSSHV